MTNLLKHYLTERQLSTLRKTRDLGVLAIHDLRAYALGKVWPMKPTFISLMANDICNSRCQMCLIWKQKKSSEFSLDELRTFVNNSFFDNVKHIGVTGGEPTLRDDLPKIFRVLCTRNVKLDGASIITNAINGSVVQERVAECSRICQEHNISFGVMVSLDGIGAVHDTVRGRPNNFKSAIQTINYFRDQGISVSFGCTITQSNAQYVDQLLDFAISEGLYGRFRVAEFIDRLYNNEQTEHIRNFDDKVLYSLGLFFYRLENCGFERNPSHLKTYRSIRSMLSEGMPRQTGCPYQTNGVVITSKAEMLYCSPKSPILGNVLKEPPSQIYFSNLWRRRKLIKNDCGNCIHDYHVSPTFIEKVSFYIKSAVRRSKYNLASLVRQATLLRGSRVNIKNISKLESRVVLIVGWYGTETAGDKAILWSIINRLKSRNLKPTRIYLASLEPFICKWTIKEMHLGDVLVVKTYTQDFEKACVDADEIIVGGGPLMDIEALNHILYAFIQGIRHGAVNRIEGCGIGPLSIDRYAQAVRQILRLSHHTTLRDAMSVMRCRDEFTIPNVQEAPDPATDFVKFYAADKIRSSSSNRGFSDNAVSCFLREWTYEYSGRIDHNQFLEIKSSFESELAKLTLYVFRAISAHCIQLLPMHSFYTGGDDRIFNRYMESRIKKDSKSNQGVDVNVANMPMAPSEILESMSNSSFNICMRFHSVLFAENLGVPYVAIDYTMGGKIKAFLEGRNQLYRLISVKDVAHGSWSDKIDNILSGLSA